MYEEFQLLWDQTLNKIENEYDYNIYDELFRPCKTVYKFHKSIIYVVAPSQFHKSRIEQFYMKDVVTILQEVSGKQYDLKFITEDYIASDQKISIVDVDPEIDKLYRSNLKANYNFDNYVVGANNRLAYMLALQVSERPGLVANPLYIFGGVGLGKTHLMQAIGNFILDNDQNQKILYVKTEIFIEDYIKKVREGNDKEYNKKYSGIDILLIDDIQFLAKKEKSQLEFFKLFEELHNSNKQIVITSDRPAPELKNIMDRLTSRFEWGMQVDITTPDYQTRVDILKKKIASERIDYEEVPYEIIEYIASRYSSNVRVLEGALKRVLFYVTMMNEDFSIELAKEALKSIASKGLSVGNIDITNIQREVCDYYKVPFDLLIAKTRKKNIVLARQVAMYICRDLTNASFPVIGKEFGGRDHTTVMHSIDKIEKLKITNNDIMNDLNTLSSKLKD